MIKPEWLDVNDCILADTPPFNFLLPTSLPNQLIETRFWYNAANHTLYYTTSHLTSWLSLHLAADYSDEFTVWLGTIREIMGYA